MSKTKLPNEMVKAMKDFNKDHTIDSAVEIFRFALESSPIPLLLSTEDGEFLIMSDSCFSETGYTKEEIGNMKDWVTTLHKGNVEYNLEFIKANFDRGVVLQGEVEKVVTKDQGVKYWAFHNTQMGQLEDGRKVQMTLCVDVTEEYSYRQQTVELLDDLEQSQMLLQASLESQDTVLLLDKNFEYLYFNENHRKNIKELYGVDIEVGTSLLSLFTVESDREKEIVRYKRALSGESFIEVDVYGQNQDIYFETKYSPLVLHDEVVGISIFTSNVTDKLRQVEAVKESEEKFRLIYSTMSQGLAIHEIITDENDKPIDYKCLEVNDSYMKLFGYKREDIVGKRIKEVAPDIEDYWIEVFGKVALTGESAYYENYSRVSKKHLATYTYSPKPGQFAVLISDVTDRVKREKEIEFLSYNDPLTGLYNRRYYEEKTMELNKKEYLPISIIVGDVNGLKLVNDSFGHQYGDKLLKEIASKLKESTRGSDIVTKIGGDEFVIILPNTGHEITKTVIKRIDENLKDISIESVEVSVSFGTATKGKLDQTFDEIFKIAEDKMYQSKATDSKSMRSKTIDLIMTTLYEKNEREMYHSKRVGAYCEALAKAMGFTGTYVNQIKNAGLMHDIGKIGIEESLLNKVEPLTKKEFKTLYQHSEIGSRILSSIPEYVDIAKFVLEHHERIDGKGYPAGLKGDEISIQARIINIADSYDAMTGPRPYKPPLKKKEAIEELKRCSGTQFDAEIVEVFINDVLKKGTLD